MKSWKSKIEFKPSKSLMITAFHLKHPILDTSDDLQDNYGISITLFFSYSAMHCPN